MRSFRILLMLLLTAGALRLLAPPAMAVVVGPLPTRADEGVTAAAALLGATLALWYLVTAATALVASVLHGVASDRAGERGLTVRAARLLHEAVRRFGAPVLRHSLGISLGVGLTVGTSAAVAGTADLPVDLRPGAPITSTESATDAPSDPTRTPAPPFDDAASRIVVETPADASAGASAHDDAADASDAADAGDAAQRQHTVQPGECLWHIAAAELGTTDEAAVAAAWPRWHALNAEIIGADPSLIHPGQVLLVPPTEVGP